jgi:hypothetical protein
MARTQARAPDRERVLRPARRLCPACGGAMRIRYENRRTLVTLRGIERLRLKIRRCEAPGCTRFHKPYRPEAEGALALPQHEFGLDVVALVGVLRHRDHRSVPEIHAILRARGVSIAERSVTNLLDRYDEVLATQLSDPDHLRGRLHGQGRIILALDGLQPDVGHEVLWVLRDCLSGTVLLARSLLSGTAEDLAVLLREVVETVGVPVVGVISDGQHSIRKAVAAVLRGSVRLVAGITTRLQVPSGRDLGRVDYGQWQDLRRQLERRRQARTARTRFRRDPDAYLAALELQAQQPTLPS